jgi:hypothetical protein
MGVGSNEGASVSTQEGQQQMKKGGSMILHFYIIIETDS